jgi:hypothetical protein
VVCVVTHCVQVLDSLGLSEVVLKPDKEEKDKEEKDKEEKDKEEKDKESSDLDTGGGGSQQPPLQQQQTSAAPSAATATLKYMLLSKVTSARIQPRRNLFSLVGPVKQVLEENLRRHSALSEGDVLTVYHRGTEHSLVVRELTLDSDRDTDEGGGEGVKGGGDDVMDVVLDSEDSSSHGAAKGGGVRGGTLINTDVVVEIDVSEEYLSSKEAEKLLSSGTASSASASSSSGAFAGSSDSEAGGGAGGGGRVLGSSGASLPLPAPPSSSCLSPGSLDVEDEPVAGTAGVITCKVKTPQGQTFTRRFEKSKPLLHLFAFVRRVLNQQQQQQQPGGGQEEEEVLQQLQLSTRRPPRKFTEREVLLASSGSGSDECGDVSAAAPTFSSAGIESNNELFFISFA